MSRWNIIEGRQGWEAQRNGVRVVHGPAPTVWAYVARHADDAEPVTVRYASGRLGLVQNGADVRVLVGQTRRTG